jgi:hypothetical protein
MTLAKKYLDTDKENIKIKFTISFNKDTYHWATSETKEKGYQLTATPVEKGEHFESFTAFNGFYEIIYPVQRQSKKRLDEAIDGLNMNMPKYIKYFEDRGYKIKL